MMTDSAFQEASTPSVGQLLKEARETQGVSLEVVSKHLCIGKRQLANLEADNENLTCDVYTLGFLRSYAGFLKLDATAIVQKFRDQSTAPPTEFLAFCTPLPEGGKPTLRILGFSLLALVCIVAAYEWWGGRSPAPSQRTIPPLAKIPLKKDVKSVKTPVLSQAIVPSVDPVAQNIPLPPADVVAPSPSPVPDVVAPSPHSVLLKATEDTWIEVKNEKGEIVVSRLFHPGDAYEFKNPQNLTLKTGNAHGVHLTSGNKSLTFPGQQGEVKVGIVLDPKKWADN